MKDQITRLGGWKGGLVIGRFLEWLEDGGGVIGEVAVWRDGDRFVLAHRDDIEAAEFELFTEPEAARRIALYTDAGAYRPLKTARNLRHGWRLELTGEEALFLALDLLYPAVLGVFAAFEEGRLKIVPLRETLGRQSGMYAATRKLTDAEAQETIRSCCREGECLKKILWPIEPGTPVTSPNPSEGKNFPLLCNEACNWLVAAARKTVKERE